MMIVFDVYTAKDKVPLTASYFQFIGVGHFSCEFHIDISDDFEWSANQDYWTSELRNYTVIVVSGRRLFFPIVKSVHIIGCFKTYKVAKTEKYLQVKATGELFDMEDESFLFWDIPEGLYLPEIIQWEQQCLGDPEAKLIYGDWLEEHGIDNRASFMRESHKAFVKATAGAS